MKMMTMWLSLRRRGISGAAMLACMIGLATLSGCMTSQPTTGAFDNRPVPVAPPWAPSYDDGRMVRYYYLPDYEVYYDVLEHEFAYLEDGNWIFTRTLPGPYANVDLSNAFVVVLNERVYEPWMHHEYYMAHYPRYYYLSVYNTHDARQFRGFNENGERTLRAPGEVRGQQHNPGAPPPPNQFPTLPVGRAPIPGGGTQGPDVRKPGDERHPVVPAPAPAPAPPPAPAPAPLPVATTPVRPQGGDHAAHPPRTPQPVHYYGDSVGKPVKVEPHMTRPTVKDKDKEKEKPKEKDH